MTLATTDRCCFRDLQNYTTLKQASSCTERVLRFRDLQNYTTLKHRFLQHIVQVRFRDLQNYTTLKPQIKFEAQE